MRMANVNGPVKLDPNIKLAPRLSDAGSDVYW